MARHTQSAPWLALATVLLATFMAQFDVYVSNAGNVGDAGDAGDGRVLLSRQSLCYNFSLRDLTRRVLSTLGASNDRKA